MTARCLPVLLALAAACTPKIQEQYSVELVGQLDKNYLVGATKAVLEVNDTVVATTDISPGRSFNLTGKGINTTTTPSGVFRVKALDAMNRVVAVGESPEIELELASPPVVRIFMQQVGTFGRHFDLDYPRREMFAVPALAVVGVDTRAKPVTVGLIGLGSVVVTDTATNTTVEKPSPSLQMYNPITQVFEDAGTVANTVARVSPGATTHPDGRALIFGGEATVEMKPPAPSGQLDVLTIARTDFDKVLPTTVLVHDTEMMGVPRISPVLVYTDTAYAIGGRADMPLDTITAINPEIDQGAHLLPLRMSGPRERHTATVVSISGGLDVLIFGGAPAGADVAQLLTPPGPNLVTPAGDAGGPRRDHAALLLPSGDRVLIIGGHGETDAVVRGDTILYTASNRTLSPGPITLRRPRAAFAAFIVGDDLVVAGGVDATGAFLDTAEVYSASTLQPKNLDLPCVPRTGASVVVLPNRLVLVAGGTGPDAKTKVVGALSAVEAYQPPPK
jgi:hypothetical protein